MKQEDICVEAMGIGPEFPSTTAGQEEPTKETAPAPEAVQPLALKEAEPDTAVKELKDIHIEQSSFALSVAVLEASRASPETIQGTQYEEMNVAVLATPTELTNIGAQAVVSSRSENVEPNELSGLYNTIAEMQRRHAAQLEVGPPCWLRDVNTS